MLMVMASEGGSGTTVFLSVFDSGRRAAGQPLPLQNSTSDPGMSMKTKSSVKKSWAGADVAFERLMRHPGFVRLRAGFRREQSENVYENKEFGKKVMG